MSRKKYSNNYFQIGFTLIELLVVVAIIAILVGITMPSLSRSREISRKTVCKSNLHAVSISLNAYSDTECNGMYPGDVQLMRSLYPKDEAKGISEVLGIKYLGDLKVLRCPSDRENKDENWDGDKVTYFEAEGTSYEYPPFVQGKRADVLMEKEQTVMFDFEAFHVLAASKIKVQSISTADADAFKKGFHDSGLKGSVNFLYPDGSVCD